MKIIFLVGILQGTILYRNKEQIWFRLLRLPQNQENGSSRMTQRQRKESVRKVEAKKEKRKTTKKRKNTLERENLTLQNLAIKDYLKIQQTR